MQLKLDQEKVARQSAENRLLEVEKYKSELSVDIKQYEQQITNLQNEYRSEKDKVKWISSLISYYIYYVNSLVCVIYIYTVIDLFCENRFLREMSHRRQSLRFDM